MCVALARGLLCRSGGPGRTGCRAADRAVLRQGGQLAKGYNVGVMKGRRGRGSEGGMGEDAVGLAEEAPTAAAAPLAPAPSAAIGLLLKMTLITMDEGARVALNLRRRIGVPCGCGGEGGRRWEAGGLPGGESTGEPRVTWDCHKHGVDWMGGQHAPRRTARARAPARGRPEGHEIEKPM